MDVRIDSIPHLTISWDMGSPSLDLHLENKLFVEESGVRVGHQNFSPSPVKKSKGPQEVLIIGSPIIGDKIDRDQVATSLFEKGAKSLVPQLNGQFLLLHMDREKRTLRIFNDRFNGVPLYYCIVKNRFVASFLYFDLYSFLKKHTSFRNNGLGMFEFIFFQRLFGDKTYDPFSKFLMPASVLTLNERDGVGLKPYWRPNFQKRTFNSDDEAGERFSYLLKQSVRRRTNDSQNKKFGLFLSGGHDSRTLLSGFEDLPVCLTVAFSDNYEVMCARRVAKSVGAEHHFFKFDDNHYFEHQNTMAKLCGGMYATDNGQFVGLGKWLKEVGVETVFHGHGFDYFFHGMYLPCQIVQLFGRPTFFKRLRPIPNEVAKYFSENISHRISNIDLFSFMRSERKEEVRSYILGSLNEVLERGADICETSADSWEYLMVHALGRHYSNPNLTSMMSAAEQRTAAFDNDLYDFYCSLPAKNRLNGTVLRYELKKGPSSLSRIPTGNYGIAAGASPAYKTAFLIGRKALRHITGWQHLQAPSAEDRTWPDRDRYMRSHPDYFNMVDRALKSDELRESLDFFDWDKMDSEFTDWPQKKSGGAKFLVSLLSLHGLIRAGSNDL